MPRTRPPRYVRYEGGTAHRYPSSGSGCLWIVAILFALMLIGLILGPVR